MMQSDEMIVGKRVSLCVFCCTGCICAVWGGNIKASLLPSPFQTDFVVACVCGCYMVYWWHPVDLFVTLYKKKIKKSTYHPHANQSRARGMLGCREPRWKPARRPPIRWSSFRCPTGQRPAGSARCTAASSNQSGLPSEEEQHGRAAVSDTKSTHCCSPQRSDLQATWPLCPAFLWVRKTKRGMFQKKKKLSEDGRGGVLLQSSLEP